MVFIKGYKMSDEHKKKIAHAHIGMKPSKKTLKKLSESHKGQHNSIVTEYRKGQKAKNWNGFKKGSIPWNYKGGVASLINMMRTSIEYVTWRNNIFKLNDYTCQDCGERGGDKEAHHAKISFAKLRNEFLQQYNQFSIHDDKHILSRLAQNHKPFWDLNNGITLCKKCHKRRHKKAIGDQ